uniref:Uncharacterized protein n=1 Tax=Pan troglodytes TaxID=9598 RepID=A0A2I3RZR0_PANTR
MAAAKETSGQNCFQARESICSNARTDQNTHPLEMKHGAHIYDARMFSC